MQSSHFLKLKINFNIECVYRINNRSIKIFALAQRCRGAPSSTVSRINWNVGMLFFRWKEETLAENAKKNDRTGARREQKKKIQPTNNDESRIRTRAKWVGRASALATATSL